MRKRYLAWDTASVTGAVAAFEVGEAGPVLVAEWALSLETSRHSERLLWTIDTVLQSAGWALSDLSGIAVGVGPGSFTGLRIGITTAAMLAAQLKIPVIPISSLVLLARPVVDAIVDETPKALVIAATDATKGEWFTLMGSAKAIQNGKSVEAVMTPESVFEEAKKILKKSKEPWIAIGQSVERYAEAFQQLPSKRRIKLLTPFLNQVQPRVLAQLAYEAIQAGAVQDPLHLRPRYLRASEAEVKLSKGLLKPQPNFFPGGTA